MEQTIHPPVAPPLPDAPPAESILKRGDKPRVVIVGGGFSGAYCAKALERHARDDAEVVLIDRHNYFVFYPLLIEAGTGMLAPQHTVVSIRNFLKRSAFLMAELTDVNFDANTLRVVTQDGRARTVEYDHLVLAMGSITKFPPVPGLKEFAYEIKSVAQTVALRDRAVQCLEQADATDDEAVKRRLLHFVVVGGSYTGVEVAGEYHAYLTEAARAYPRLHEKYVKLTLVDTNDRILSTLPESLSHWAGTRLTRRGVDLRLKDTITEVTVDGVRLRSGEWIECSTVIWAAGIAPPPVLEKLGLPTDHGWLLCEADGRVRGRANVWGIGDAAMNPDPKSGKGYPATAQHALQEGAGSGKNIARVIAGMKTQPIVAKTRGVMAPLGRYDAVALVYGVRLKGILAWILWRGFYLTKVPGVGRGLHVLTDWLSAILFGRDFVELGVHQIVRIAKRDTDSRVLPTPESPAQTGL